MSENDDYECLKSIIRKKNKNNHDLQCTKNVSRQTKNKKGFDIKVKDSKKSTIQHKSRPKYRKYTPDYHKLMNNKELDKEVLETFICWICGKTIPEKVREAHLSYHKDEDEKANNLISPLDTIMKNKMKMNKNNKEMDMNNDSISIDTNTNNFNTMSMILNNNSDTNISNNSFNMNMNNNVMGMNMNNNVMGMNMNNNVMGMNNILNVDNINLLNSNINNEEQLIDLKNMTTIKQIIKPYEERIKELEEKIRQKDLEISFLKVKFKYNDNLNNNYLFTNYNHMINQNNFEENPLYHMMNNNSPENNNEIRNEENLKIYFIKNKHQKILIPCHKNDKINNIINKFCTKSNIHKSSYIFTYKEQKLNYNSNEEIGNFGLNNNDEILVVEKNDNKINNEINSSKKDINSEDNDFSEDSKNSDNLSDNNTKNDIEIGRKVSIFFHGPGGKKMFNINPKESIRQLLLLYIKKFNLKMESIEFIHNGSRLSFDDERTIENVFISGNMINVIVLNQMFGA